MKEMNNTIFVMNYQNLLCTGIIITGSFENISHVMLCGGQLLGLIVLVGGSNNSAAAGNNNLHKCNMRPMKSGISLVLSLSLPKLFPLLMHICSLYFEIFSKNCLKSGKTAIFSSKKNNQLIFHLPKKICSQVLLKFIYSEKAT